MALPSEASLGATCPTLEMSGQVHRVPGSCPWNWTLSLPPGGPRVFPWTTLPGRSPTPRKGRVPREELGPASVPHQVEWAGVGGARGAHGHG